MTDAERLTQQLTRIRQEAFSRAWAHHSDDCACCQADEETS